MFRSDLLLLEIMPTMLQPRLATSGAAGKKAGHLHHRQQYAISSTVPAACNLRGRFGGVLHVL